MSSEEVHATHLSDKNGMDEDARTESSEGSNPQPTDGADSEDEFVDAMEPPSSTSGMLLTFDGVTPPVSGVYEDAVEATDEQLLAALEEGSEGRQSMIQEEEEAETEEVEEQVAAVVEEIAESTAAEEQVTPVKQDVDIQVEEVAETLTKAIEVVVQEESRAEDVVQDEAVNEEPAQEKAVVGDQSSEELAEDAVVENDAETESVGVETEGNAAIEETEQSVEANAADDEYGSEEPDADEQESSAVVTVESDEAEAQKTTKTDETVETELNDAVNGGEAIPVSAATGIAHEIAPEETAVAEPDIEAVDPAEVVAEPDDTDTTSDLIAGTAAVSEHEVGTEITEGESALDNVDEAEADASEEALESPVEETVKLVVHESIEDTAVDTEQNVSNSEAHESEDAAVGSVEAVAPATEEAEQEITSLNKALTDQRVEMEAPVNVTESGEDEQADAAESNTNSEDKKATASEVEATVIQVTDELVEAIEENAAEALEDVPEQECEAANEAEQDPAEEETDSVTAPASAAKEVSSRTSSEENQQHLDVVMGLLPRLGPSSGTTTTTTSIEPFVLSSDSNEMMEVHLPPQRWTYDVYGFSIENRVVYYHIHRSDRRTGIREPPILKRFSDFRELQIQLLDTRLRVAIDMPYIPRPHLGVILRGYKSKKTIETREKAFRALLRYIALYPALHTSAVFERFITTSRVTIGATWM